MGRALLFLALFGPMIRGQMIKADPDGRCARV